METRPRTERGSGTPEPLDVVAVSAVRGDHGRPSWLVDGLWSAEGVGVIGGAPKCCKTWLGLDLAVSVSSGTDALGRFPVVCPGPVLLYGAEDATVRLRERIESIAAARGLTLDELPLGLIDVPALRLDTERDLARLRATLAEHRPRLVILDPLVRLHRIDENSAGEMSALLGELRAIQRDHHLAIVLVHHLRKNGAAQGQDGQSLRGSGDLHAWGDSNLYLRRRDRHIRLTIEHRSAPSPEPCLLELVPDPPHLRVVDDDGAPDPKAAADVADRIVEILVAAAGPVGRDALRAAVHARNATLGEALVRLRADRRIERCEDGFRLAPPQSHAIPVPASTEIGNGNGASS